MDKIVYCSCRCQNASDSGDFVPQTLYRTFAMDPVLQYYDLHVEYDCETANVSLLYATKCTTRVKSCQGGAGRWACDGIMEHPTLLILYY